MLNKSAPKDNRIYALHYIVTSVTPRPGQCSRLNHSRRTARNPVTSNTTTSTIMDSSSIDPKNGYCSKTKTYHNLRPPVPLPPETLPLSAADYVLSLLSSTASAADLGAATFLVDAAAEISLPYSEFLRRVASLKSQLLPKLSKGKVALVLSPASIHVPVLYFALLSLGVVVSPANPLATEYELAHMIRLAQPSIAFTVTSLSGKLPNASLPFGIVCLDSPAFDSMLAGPIGNPSALNSVSVRQSDSAAILYSSGTTGKIKGVELTHRNLIALISGFHHTRSPDEEMTHPVSLFTIPLFHVFGFFMLLRSVAMAETLVLMQRFDFEGMLSAVEKYRITYMPVSPPVVLGFAKSELTNKYDLSSLELLGCGGAPLGKEVAERFRTKFPNVEIVQGYGLTETGGGGARPMDPDDSKRYGSVGRLAELLEAKIVDPTTGEALPPGQRGELWLRGPTIMKGYVGDNDSTSKTLDPDGWLKTGDVCYFDAEGFLYVVDRLKELIKYKAYQVPPAELEQLLLSHPDIADAAVIPYPDEEAGQIPMAFVVRKPGSSVTGAQIMDFIARKVAPYKKIRRVSFINSIPKSAAGKILRRVLIDQAVSNGLARL